MEQRVWKIGLFFLFAAVIIGAVYTNTEEGVEDITGMSSLNDFEGDNVIKSDSLSGSGNAYACISSDGTLFRSDVPCS